jgi:hypothetical protein
MFSSNGAKLSTLSIPKSSKNYFGLSVDHDCSKRFYLCLCYCWLFACTKQISVDHDCSKRFYRCLCYCWLFACTKQILACRYSVFLEIMKSLEEQPYWSDGSETHVAFHLFIWSQTSLPLHMFVSLLQCNFWLPNQLCNMSVTWCIIVQIHRNF